MTALAAMAIALAQWMSLRPEHDLQQGVEQAEDGTVIRLAPGVYELGTSGLRVAGKAIHLTGAGPSNTILRAPAGRGIQLESGDLGLFGLTIAGGKVEVRRGLLRMENCRMERGELHGGEGAVLLVRDAELADGFEDAVTLGRSARATIEDCLIEGARGAAVTAAGDARALVRGSLIRRCAAGIGSFEAAEVIAEENAIEDIAGWGLAQGAEREGERPAAFFRRNAVDARGGIRVQLSPCARASSTAGGIVDNLVLEAGSIAPGHCPRDADPERLCASLGRWRRPRGSALFQAHCGAR